MNMPNKNEKKRTKTGGRKAGTPNKASVFRERMVAASGQTPLAYLIQIMRDETLDIDRRIEAAKAAAPYVHPRLAAIEHRGDAANPINVQVGFRWMTEAEARARGWA